MPALTQAELAPLLPHGGAMRLLDSVERWDASSISSRATSHRDVRNPLRHAGRLAAVTGLEYAAQTMGIHAKLLSDDQNAEGVIGYVGGVREFLLAVERLDTLSEDLLIDATRLLEGEASVMYEFRMTAGDRFLVSGRASIFFARVPA
jgi:predicted hotdog family 3-hydroxylacyl-ACP dehydratase